MTTSPPKIVALVIILNGLAAVAPARPDAGSSPAIAATAGREPMISKEISTAVLSGIRYQPPNPSANEELDPHDSDRPQNGIIRLPKYVVEEQRPPVFSERNLYTPENLRRLAYLRYTNAFSRRFRLVPGWYAMMQYEAEERRRNLAEMEDKVFMYRISGDNKSAEALKTDIQRTFMRRSEGISIHVAGD